MLSNSALDIAIGLVLMYLVLSLSCTIINEYIATTLQLRAKTLESALQHILDDGSLRDAFYKQGLIRGAQKATDSHPSYLAGETFALTLLSSLAPLDPTKPIPGFADVQTAVQNLPDCSIKSVLLSHLAAAKGDIDKLRTGIANYFDHAMDRLSGLYKRYLKWISLGIGALLVVALNADSVSIGRALWSDSSLRQQISQDALKFISEPDAQPVAQPNAAAGSQAPDTPKLEDRIKNLENNVRPLPIGWPDRDFSPGGKMSWSGLLTWAGIFWLLAKIFGLVISMFAVSLGAPFWFDTLSMFVNLRGTGPKPDRTAATT